MPRISTVARPALYLFLLIVWCAPAAGDTIAPDAYARVNTAILNHHVLPRYERLAAATARQTRTAQEFCMASDSVGLADVRATYHETMDAWMAVQHIRLGPVELYMRAYRLYFWPEARGKVGDAVDSLLAMDDPGVLAAERLADASVAVQGLPAIEYLLYTDDSLPGEGATASLHCSLLMGIASNMLSIAEQIVADWQGGDVSFRRLFLNPGPDNDYYQTHRDASLALFKNFHDALALIADAKLKPVVGESNETARPALAESRSSGRSLRNIVLNLEALQALYLGEGDAGLSTLVKQYGTDKELDPLMRTAFGMTIEAARDIDGPLVEAVADEARREQVETLSTRVIALKQIVKSRVAPALDLAVGFNALDGD